MAYFRCGQGSGGGGSSTFTIEIETDSPSLYGQSITISKSGTAVGITVFDNTGHAEYTVDEPGTYRASCTYSGVTFYDEVTFSTVETAMIYATPQGSTVTPTDVVNTLLKCANIWDKNYTTISQLLSDTSALLTVTSTSNSVDYLVRSTTWAADVCADSTAMTYIGSNNYCADTLLADATWLNAIISSAYKESVLNVKVPTMTSDTTPSGVASASSVLNPSVYAYMAFNQSDDTSWGSAEDINDQWVEYEFPSPVKLYQYYIKPVITISGSSSYTKTAQVSVQGYINDEWVDISSKTLVSNPTSSGSNTTPAEIRGDITNNAEIRRVRVNFGEKVGVQRDGVFKLQYYGRADV